jgi:hypothetical protein
MHKALDKITKAFMWVGSDEVQGGKCLLAWQKVQHPLDLGSLRILDLRLFGRALRMCWLWMQHNKPSRSWAKLPFQEDKAPTLFFHASTIVELGDGTVFRF